MGVDHKLAACRQPRKETRYETSFWKESLPYQGVTTGSGIGTWTH